MHCINRMVVVLRPRSPFVEWANALPDAGDLKLSLDELNEDCTVFLIPDFPDGESALRHIKKIYDDIFVIELEGICLLEEWWPHKRTWKMFLEWFDIEIHSSVLDTSNDPIHREEG